MNYAPHQAELDKLRSVMGPTKRFSVVCGNHGTWAVMDDKYGIPMQVNVKYQEARQTAERFNFVYGQMK